MYHMYIAKILEICYIWMYNMLQLCLYHLLQVFVASVRLWKTLWKTQDTCACIICTWQIGRLLPKSAIRSDLYYDKKQYSESNRKQYYVFLDIYLLSLL